MEHDKKSSKFISWFLTKPKTTGFLVFLMLSFVISFIVSQRYQITKEKERREMNTILNAVHRNIEQSLKNCYTTTLTLALTINDNGVPENFEYFGAKLLESNASIDAVQLVPNGVIKYTYPMKGNEQAMNLNILESPSLKKEALKSIENQKMYFAGPFELKQGGLGIVGRLPVFKKNKFWGFSAVIIRMETLLKISGISAIDSTKYYFQISKISPVTQKEEFFLPSKKDFSKNFYVSPLITDGDWRLYLFSKNQYHLYPYILLPGILGLILAALFGILLTAFLRKPAELQLLVHNQATKLLNAEIKFKTIFDQAAVGMAHVDSYSGNYIEINTRHCNMVGYTPQEMKQKNFQSITHPDDLEEDLLNLKKLREGKIREYSMEKRYITKSGTIIWVYLTVSPLWKLNEKATTHICIVEDITLKKEAEDLIKKSEIRFKSLFDDSPVALWEEDFSSVKNYLGELNLIGEKPEIVADYLNSYPEVVQKCISLVKVIDVNNECLAQYAPKTKSELIDRNRVDILFGKESLESFTTHLCAICNGQKQLMLDTQIKKPTGEIRDIHLRYSVMKGYEESLERVIISTEDITDRKAAEKIIHSSQKRIKSLINTIDGIVWECDVETFSFSFISKKVEDILGFTAKEWMESPTFWEDHIYPDDKKWATDYCASNTKENLNHDFEYRMIAKNGSIIWLRDIVNVVIENGIAVSLRGIMIDITKTKEAEKDLINSLSLVTEQNKRLLNFSYIVSHNLRSHTSNIEAITSLIDSSESEEETKQMVQLLKSVSNSLNETMHNLNEVVSIQTNIGLLSESLNLNQYIDNIQNILSEQILMKEASIANNIPHDVIINYNPAYLESILLNLISNAIRYSHPKRKPIITLEYLTENNIKVLQITDNGIGIDLKKHGDKIFGMYKTFSTNNDSRGIGLFITKNQIEAMGGSISVESELHRGTTFKIYIK
jgi:PAS domain S-box-containing protein